MGSNARLITQLENWEFINPKMNHPLLQNEFIVIPMGHCERRAAISDFQYNRWTEIAAVVSFLREDNGILGRDIVLSLDSARDDRLTTG